jgi:hypothetical protein
MSSRKRPRDRETTGRPKVAQLASVATDARRARINVEDLAHSAPALRKSSQDVFHLSRSSFARLPGSPC